jgi:Fungal specific transcription factor domain
MLTILAQAIGFCSPGPIRSIVFPEAIRTPALLSAMLYMAYAHLSSLRGPVNQELAIGLKTATIAHINRKLSHPATAMCTNVIASIAYLSTGTWVKI